LEASNSIIYRFQINPKKDSSLAMMLEAVRRGWEVWTFDTTDLFADKSGVYACTSQTLVTDNLEHWFEAQIIFRWHHAKIVAY
jgi:glutathione synthase/RimK-type ligase-like ATP-grasp enzyme